MITHQPQEGMASARLTEKLLAALEGGEITIIYPEQRLGNIYTARVLMIEGNILTVNLPRRVAGPGYLRVSTPVIINFIVNKLLYQAAAEFRAEGEEMREVIIRGAIEETTRRHFTRIPFKTSVGYVPISDLSLSSGRLPRNNWQQCRVGDISGGGVLIQTRNVLQVGAYLLLNVEIESFHGPFFIVGQVRWVGISGSTGRFFQCGIMFIPYEDWPYHFSPPAFSWMPPIMQQFDRMKQDELDRFLEDKTSESKGEPNDKQKNFR
jgi:hypothetical protein